MKIAIFNHDKPNESLVEELVAEFAPDSIGILSLGDDTRLRKIAAIATKFSAKLEVFDMDFDVHRHEAMNFATEQLIDSIDKVVIFTPRRRPKTAAPKAWNYGVSEGKKVLLVPY